METGLIGLPLSGKTTIFNAVTGRTAATSAYAGGKKETNIADINVPDARVDALSGLFKPKRTVYAKVLLKDLQFGLDEHGGISAGSLAEIRNLSAIAIVVRQFESESVTHPLGSLEPARDLRKIVDSLIFSDYELVDKRKERMAKEGKKGSREYQVLDSIAGRLMENRLLGESFIAEADMKLLSGLSLVTNKPMMIVANTGGKSSNAEGMQQAAQALDLPVFSMRGDMEMEIAQLDKADQKEFLAEIGTEEPALDRFIQHVYRTLNLISFLTVGEDEVRAWSIRNGYSAHRAAGRIHSDLEKGFIRAEVVSTADLLSLKGLAEAKRLGKLRQEGKDYIVKDGDVLNILFNV